MLQLPEVLPSSYAQPLTHSSSTPDVDTGGYDVLIGGHGFRLATDQQMPYERGTEPTTVRRFDSSEEPGEQTLSQLPWIKSQSSFHAGAGQLNLEAGLTSFQYQQEQVEHIRYDTSLGVDVWTPGKVSRLPDMNLYTIGFTSPATCIEATTIGGVDYAMVGGAGRLARVRWGSGADQAPSVTPVDLSGTAFSSASNVTILSLTTDGAFYYALVSLTTAVGGVNGYVIKGAMDSTSAPTCLYDITGSVRGAVSWEKARLVAGIAEKFYELSNTATAHTALPVAKYTHPVATDFTFTAFASSPTGILSSGNINYQSSILEFKLDSSGGTPVLSGGAVVDVLPRGELVTALETLTGAFVGVGTTRGLRVAQFDGFNNFKQGPVSVSTTLPVAALAARDRFFYGSYSDQQADGSTGLVRVDVSMITDTAGRMAYAPDLRPPLSASSRVGQVLGISLLPKANRVVFIAPDGLHVEGHGPGTDGDAWLRTSRVRYDTAEMKLFKLGRIRGSLDTSQISVTGYTPFSGVSNLGTFGFIASGDPGEFRLPGGLNEWLQLQFGLDGPTCTLTGYQVKALPAPTRQRLISFTVNCFSNEVDRYGLEVTDPEPPRSRYANVQALEKAGDEVRLVEFTNTGAVAELCVIDQLDFRGYSRPGLIDDFGGYITFRLRTTE